MTIGSNGRFVRSGRARLGEAAATLSNESHLSCAMPSCQFNAVVECAASVRSKWIVPHSRIRIQLISSCTSPNAITQFEEQYATQGLLTNINLAQVLLAQHLHISEPSDTKTCLAALGLPSANGKSASRATRPANRSISVSWERRSFLSKRHPTQSSKRSVLLVNRSASKLRRRECSCLSMRLSGSSGMRSPGSLIALPQCLLLLPLRLQASLSYYA